MRRISGYIKLAALLFIGTVALVHIFEKKANPAHEQSDNMQINTKESMPDQITKKPVRVQSDAITWPPCQRNESASNVTGFSSLPGHIQDFLYYRHCRHFPMLLDVPDKCGGPQNSADVFLLLVIKSSPWNYDRREVLRKTWAEERIQNGVRVR